MGERASEAPWEAEGGETQDRGNANSLSTWGPCCSLQNERAGTNRWTAAAPEAEKDKWKSAWPAQVPGPTPVTST